jgi:small subunit ribosomal protein S4
MGRYTGPSCRQCRREGMKLMLKGMRCYMAKCPIETGRPAPGIHGQRRSRKQSDYGVQLREKQRLRRQYGLQEAQFHLFFERASQRSGVTGEQLLQSLEARLDNVVYRLGFAGSRKAARQFVLHNHIRVNGGKANVPSMQIDPGAVIEVSEKKKSRELAARNLETNAARDVPSWMTLDVKNYRGEYIRVPTREEIAPIVNEQLIVELYSK